VRVEEPVVEEGVRLSLLQHKSSLLAQRGLKVKR
jgi:hypothetical protein